jgi:hypothetical protein
LRINVLKRNKARWKRSVHGQIRLGDGGPTPQNASLGFESMHRLPLEYLASLRPVAIWWAGFISVVVWVNSNPEFLPFGVHEDHGR